MPVKDTLKVLDTVPLSDEEGHRDTELEEEERPEVVTEFVRDTVTVLLPQNVDDKVPLFDTVNVGDADVVREVVGEKELEGVDVTAAIVELAVKVELGLSETEVQPDGEKEPAPNDSEGV